MCKANLDNNIHFVVEYKNLKKKTQKITLNNYNNNKKNTLGGIAEYQLNMYICGPE